MKAREQNNYPLRLNELRDKVFLEAMKSGLSVNNYILKVLRKELKIK
jgi:predicted HicB family RNase H-like nuclease